MKKVVLIILLLSFMALLGTSCNRTNNDNTSLEFILDKDGYYTGFSNLPTNYSIQDAKDDGYFVTQDLKVVANNNVWGNFIKTSMEKENSGIRIVQFFKDSAADPFFLDLFYHNGHYYLFDSTSKNQQRQPFLHLLILEGKYGNPLKDSDAIVLTNDDTLTFDMVMKSLVSSSTVEINKIPPFKIVMFR